MERQASLDQLTELQINQDRYTAIAGYRVIIDNIVEQVKQLIASDISMAEVQEEFRYLYTYYDFEHIIKSFEATEDLRTAEKFRKDIHGFFAQAGQALGITQATAFLTAPPAERNQDFILRKLREFLAEPKFTDLQGAYPAEHLEGMANILNKSIEALIAHAQGELRKDLFLEVLENALEEFDNHGVSGSEERERVATYFDKARKIIGYDNTSGILTAYY